MWTDPQWNNFLAAFDSFWPGHFGKTGDGAKLAQWRAAVVKFRSKAAVLALQEIYENQEFPRAPTLKLFRETAKAMDAGTVPSDSRQGHCDTCLDVRTVTVEMFLLPVNSPVLQGASVKLAEEFRWQGETWDAVDVRVGEKLPEAKRITFDLWCPGCSRSWVPGSWRAQSFENRLRGKFRATQEFLSPHLRAMVAGTKLAEGPVMSCKEIAADLDTWRLLRDKYGDDPDMRKRLDNWQRTLARGEMPTFGIAREPGDETEGRE